MSQDSNTESDSNAKKRLTLKRKPTARDETAPAAGSSSPDTPRMKFSPRAVDKPEPPAAKPEEPLVPRTPLESARPATDRPVNKPKLKTPATERSEATPKVPTTGLPLSFSSPAPANETPPTPPIEETSPPPPSAPKPPPGVKIVKDDPAPVPSPKAAPKAPSGPTPELPPVLPPVLGQASAPSDAPPPLAAPAGLLMDDLDVKPVKTKPGGRSVIGIIVIFVILLGALGGIGYALWILLASPSEDSQAFRHDALSAEIAPDTPGPAPIPTPEKPEPVSPKATAPTPVSPGPLDILPDEPEPVPTRPTLASPEPGKPDPAVATWVEQMRFNALIGNRMILGGTTYHLGDTVSTDPYIEWIGHDLDLGVLTFRDANGILYEKDY